MNFKKHFKKIVVTGIMTSTLLLGITNQKTEAATKYSMNEINLMAKLVRAEAGGESYKGKVAVAAVVINRKQHKSFPSTVSGVIYQRNQFTPVMNGSINRSPDSTSIKAVKAAVNGSDPTRNAIYFYNPRYVGKSWLISKTITTRIGNHVFAK